MRAARETVTLAKLIQDALDQTEHADTFDMSDLIWGVIEDVQNSYKAAMNDGQLGTQSINYIESHVNSYLSINYGEI